MAGKHEAHRRVVEKLEEQGAEIRRLCAGLDEDAIAKRPESGKWSVKEVLAHIARIQEIFEGRLEALLTQDKPPIVSYSPERDADFVAVAAKPSVELLKLFADGRARIVARLIALSPEDWHRPGTHPDYPDLRRALLHGVHGPPRGASHLPDVRAPGGVRARRSLTPRWTCALRAHRPAARLRARPLAWSISTRSLPRREPSSAPLAETPRAASP